MGVLYHSSALSQESREKQSWGGKGGDEGTRDTRGNMREGEHDENNERKREGQGQPAAVFPPRSLSGSGVTGKVAQQNTLAQKLAPTLLPMLSSNNVHHKQRGNRAMAEHPCRACSGLMVCSFLGKSFNRTSTFLHASKRSGTFGASLLNL